MADMPEAVL
uniref:O-succinylhomoserine sulfhydrylase n=1 Tax=Arundo donax TaxID=35708 RepID=A0A0A9FY35_ARUDO